MQTLNDYPVLGRDEIEAAFPESDLQNQIEKVRMSQIDLSLEELTRIWGTCQTEYRLSVAYEASVVLIDGARPIKAPLPILQVKTDEIQPDATEPPPTIPTLEAIALQNEQTSIRVAETITLLGYNLGGQDREGKDLEVKVIFDHPRLRNPIEIAPQPEGTDDTHVKVKLEQEGNDWLAGIYTVTLRIGGNQTTNALSLLLAPAIELLGIKKVVALSLLIQSKLYRLVSLLLLDHPITETVDHRRLLRIRCNPAVLLWQEDERLLRGQTVYLLLGDRELLPYIGSLSETKNARTNSLKFDISNIEPGDYYVRLRVDGVDSILLLKRKADDKLEPPEFDPNLKVQIPWI